jgi:hypothetical protein
MRSKRRPREAYTLQTGPQQEKEKTKVLRYTGLKLQKLRRCKYAASVAEDRSAVDGCGDGQRAAASLCARAGFTARHLYSRAAEE